MQRFSAILGLVMSIIFVLFGIIIMFYPPQGIEQYGPSIKYLAGIVLLLYGGFRLYRSYRVLTHK